jgi:hypothetical protein
MPTSRNDDDMANELREMLKSEVPERQDLVISPSVLISCIAIDDQDHSWVLPYIHLAPSRFMDSKFELQFSNLLVAVTLPDPEREPLEVILQAVAEWRLSLIANGDRFKIRVRQLDD